MALNNNDAYIETREWGKAGTSTSTSTGTGKFYEKSSVFYLHESCVSLHTQENSA